MCLVSVLIFCGLLSGSLAANDSCFSKVDFEFYLLQNLVEEVGLKVKFLKENAGGNTTSSYSTCPNTTCGDGWGSYKESCYFFAFDKANTFSYSKNFCAQLGATMLHVNDEAENNFIVGLLKHFNKMNWWIGLTDEKTEGDWRWVDTDTTAEFTPWSPGQPKNGNGQNCALYYYPDSFRWHDVICKDTAHAMHPICEKRFSKYQFGSGMPIVQ